MHFIGKTTILLVNTAKNKITNLSYKIFFVRKNFYIYLLCLCNLVLKIKKVAYRNIGQPL